MADTARRRDGPPPRRVRRVAKYVLNRHGYRREAHRNAIFRLLGRYTPAVAADRDGIRYFLPSEDMEIARYVFAHGEYDEAELRTSAELLHSVGLLDRPNLEGVSFLDIGANIGTSTLAACLALGAEASYAFEPEPHNFRFLQLNVSWNQLSARAHLFPCGLSDTDARASLEVARANKGDHRIRVVDQPGDFLEEERELLEIQLRSLDQLVLTKEVSLERVGLAWIDTQGHEAKVLAGASALLERGVPLNVEYWPYGLERAGGIDGLDALLTGSYTHFFDVAFDGNPRDRTPRPISELATVRDDYTGSHRSTNLLVVRLEG